MVTPMTMRGSALQLFLFGCLLVAAGWPALAQNTKNTGIPSNLNAGSRIALVIGNGAYERAPLRNPVNDARAMADSLRRLGFQVTLRTDVDLPKMIDAIEQFMRDGRRDDVRVFFYAGHGIQFRGKNYLVPVDVSLEAQEDIPTSLADLQEVVDHLERMGKGLNIIILDACRTFPLPGRFRAGTRGIPVKPVPGLAQITAPGGTFIAFSTAPGAVARDGAGAVHSVYTRHLLANLEIPGLTVEQVFKRVRVSVLNDTDQSQMPWENSSLIGDFCFKPGSRGQCPGG